MANRDFIKGKFFTLICEKGNIIPTKRQASKFILGKGTAFAFFEKMGFSLKALKKFKN